MNLLVFISSKFCNLVIFWNLITEIAYLSYRSNLVTLLEKSLMKNVIFSTVHKTKEVVGRFYNLPEKMNYLVLSRILWRRSRAFIVNFEQISYIVLVFPLLILKENAGWPQLTFTGICIYFKMSWTFFMLLFHKFGSNHMLNGYTCNEKTILCLP